MQISKKLPKNVRIGSVNLDLVWSLRHQVMWPDRDLDYVRLDDDRDGSHWGLYLDGTVVSVVSVFANRKEVQFRKFATLEAHQGNGYGSLLLHHVLRGLQEDGYSRIWCNARKAKTGFYERFGLACTPETFTKGGLDYVVMEWRKKD
ncbi:MAG: GNAT family N-acetyltransferase [Lunatimonas sp.]|uniref:GNAT family N-acetyltransferase n=1 Tax=Lunatimonas sp. TaxID=2060141 RepID=UPI00263B825D|nr:GNAT family N-acetyltransferase [Lunatimonas sp.]MCC5938529.1 GNAT family N-acetyltransferase [Lunatimonas sp.]